MKLIINLIAGDRQLDTYLIRLHRKKPNAPVTIDITKKLYEHCTRCKHRSNHRPPIKP